MEEQRMSRSGSWWIAAALLVFVVYPLSTAPVNWLVNHYRSPELMQIASVVYLPIYWVYKYAPAPIPDLIEWYSGLLIR